MRAPGDVGVGVERDTDIGVPELFLNDGLREGGALPPLLDFGRSWSSPLGTRGASPTAVTESGLGVRFWRPSLVPRPQHRSCRRSHLQFLIATGAALLYLALHAQRGYGYDRGIGTLAAPGRRTCRSTSTSTASGVSVSGSG